MLKISSENNPKQPQESLCDCYWPNPFVPQQTYKNRYIKRSTPHGKVNLVYLQNFQNMIQMDSEYPPFSSYFPSSSSECCAAGNCGPGNQTNAFQGNLNATLEIVLPLLNATHAFVNLGCDHLFNLEVHSKFSCAILAFVRHHPGIEVNLISHIPFRGYKGKNPSTNYSFFKELKCASGVIDCYSAAKNVQTNWYWDKQHILSILNEEHNYQVTETVCPLESWILVEFDKYSSLPEKHFTNSYYISFWAPQSRNNIVLQIRSERIIVDIIQF